MLLLMEFYGRATSQDNPTPTLDNKPKSKRKTILFPIIGLVLLVVVGYGAIYGYNQFIKNPNGSSETNLTAEQTSDVIGKIGELIELPTGEVPILATVTDVGSLSDEPFYENAQNGDRVLIYRDNKTAILYRPSENKIVKVGTVTIQEEQEVVEVIAGESDENLPEVPVTIVPVTPQQQSTGSAN